VIQNGGKLVFANSALYLTASWIRVESGGSWIMGDETCKLTAKIVVTFVGARTTSNLMGTEPEGTRCRLLPLLLCATHAFGVSMRMSRQRRVRRQGHCLCWRLHRADSRASFCMFGLSLRIVLNVRVSGYYVRPDVDASVRDRQRRRHYTPAGGCRAVESRKSIVNPLG
jgi:hypothetical protein